MALDADGAGPLKTGIVERVCGQCLAVADAFAWGVGTSEETYLAIPDREARTLLRDPSTHAIFAGGLMELPWCAWDDDLHCTVVLTCFALMREVEWSADDRSRLRAIARDHTRDLVADECDSETYIALTRLDRAVVRAQCCALLGEEIRVGEALTAAEEAAQEVNLVQVARVAQAWFEIGDDLNSALRCLELGRAYVHEHAPSVSDLVCLAGAEWLVAGDREAANRWLARAEAAAEDVSDWTQVARLEAWMNEDPIRTREACERAHKALRAAADGDREESVLDVYAMSLAAQWLLWLEEERLAAQALELAECWERRTADTIAPPYGLRQLGETWIELGLDASKGRALIAEYEELDRKWQAWLENGAEP